jgi:hypothetical protein
MGMGVQCYACWVFKSHAPAVLAQEGDPFFIYPLPPCTVFMFCSHLQRSINAFFETTHKSEANILTDGGEGELGDSAK